MGKVVRKKRKTEVEEEPTFREKYLSKDSETFKILRDLAVAGLIMVFILGGLWIYAGTWPPVVVVESGSMMHSDDSSFGVIDTGDIVVVKSVDSRSDVKSFVEGEKEGYETYSDYGDVIVYRPYGRNDVTPVIHRAMLWIDVNKSDPDAWTFDIPSLDIYALSEITDELEEYGLGHYSPAMAKHSGFITKGDNNFDNSDNPVADQNEQYPICRQPIKVDWIEGVARGEIPWFGLIKLWATDTLEGEAPQTSVTGLSISILVLVVVPILWDYMAERDEGESYITVKYNQLMKMLGIKRK